MNNEIQSKIKKIDELLENDEYLKKYIHEVENKYNFDNDKLKLKILNRLKISKKKVGYKNIIKIAACTLLAVLICECGMISYDNNDNNKEEVASDTNERSGLNILYTNLQTKLNDINGMMLNPLKIERGENK